MSDSPMLGLGARAIIGVVAIVLGAATLGIQALFLTTMTAWLTLESMPRDEAAVPLLTEWGSDKPLHVLVVGNDTRDALPSDDPYWYGTFTGQRADVVILVAVDPTDTEVRLLSLDRDLRVDTIEYGPLTISESFGYGGSSLLIRSVGQLTGLPIHHYLEVSFDGFVQFIDALDGLTVPFCGPSRDLVSGLQVPSGSMELQGEQALALVRSRAFERLVDGEWVAVDQGNAGRISRQHFLVGQLFQEIRERGRFQAIALVEAAKDMAVIDARWGLKTSLALFEAARGGSVTWDVLPTAPVRSQMERTSPFPPNHLGGRLYLEPAPEAGETLRIFSGTEQSQLEAVRGNMLDAPPAPLEEPANCV